MKWQLQRGRMENRALIENEVSLPPPPKEYSIMETNIVLNSMIECCMMNMYRNVAPHVMRSPTLKLWCVLWQIIIIEIININAK